MSKFLYNNSSKSSVSEGATGSRKARVDVADLILDDILKQGLRIGDRLPTEEVLAARFGVSRLRVREGIQGLKFLGILSSAKRGGTTIQRLDFARLGQTIRFQIAADHVDWRDLVEVRYALERVALERLSGHLAPELLAELRACADCSVQGDSEEEVARNTRLDHAFHLKLAQATGNPVLVSCQNLLRCFFENNSAFINLTDTPAREHLQILEALKDGNLELACGILRQHLNRYLE